MKKLDYDMIEKLKRRVGTISDLPKAPWTAISVWQCGHEYEELGIMSIDEENRRLQFARTHDCPECDAKSS